MNTHFSAASSSSSTSSATRESPTSHSALISRREALRRAALFLGVALTPSFVTGVLEAQTAPMTGAKPAYLTGEQIATVGSVAERILPRTDTPGALDAGVPAFIDLMYGKYMTDGDRKLFASGLAAVEASSAATHRRGFTSLTADQQDALLMAIAVVAQTQPKSFFAQIKELTILGYFTSEPVGRNVLHYDPVPGPYKGCIPLAEVGNRSWTK